MTTKKTSGSKSSVTIDDGGLQRLYASLLDRVAPGAKKIMEDTLSQIERDAIPDWPRRKPIVRTDSNGRIVFFKDTSKKSFMMWDQGYKVDPQGRLVAYLKNTAPYSYIIKYGTDSKNKQGQDIIQPTGKNVAQITLINPMKKNTTKVVKALADDLSRRL